MSTPDAGEEAVEIAAEHSGPSVGDTREWTSNHMKALTSSPHNPQLNRRDMVAGSSIMATGVLPYNTPYSGHVRTPNHSQLSSCALTPPQTQDCMRREIDVRGPGYRDIIK